MLELGRGIRRKPVPGHGSQGLFDGREDGAAPKRRRFTEELTDQRTVREQEHHQGPQTLVHDLLDRPTKPLLGDRSEQLLGVQQAPLDDPPRMACLWGKY